MDGELLQTEGGRFALAVHAAPVAAPGVRAPGGVTSGVQGQRGRLACRPAAAAGSHTCATAAAAAASQRLPVITLTLNGTNTSATILDDLSTCDNRTAGGRGGGLLCVEPGHWTAGAWEFRGRGRAAEPTIHPPTHLPAYTLFLATPRQSTSSIPPCTRPWPPPSAASSAAPRCRKRSGTGAGRVHANPASRRCLPASACCAVLCCAAQLPFEAQAHALTTAAMPSPCPRPLDAGTARDE